MPDNDSNEVVVKVAPVYADVCFTVAVDRKGHFDVAVRQGGLYLVTAVVKRRICASVLTAVKFGSQPLRVQCKP